MQFQEGHSVMEQPSNLLQTVTRHLRATPDTPARENSSEYLPDGPVKEKAKTGDHNHQNESDEFQDAHKEVVCKCEDKRDDEHVYEDESCYCHGDYFLRVNDYIS